MVVIVIGDKLLYESRFSQVSIQKVERNIEYLELRLALVLLAYFFEESLKNL